MHSVIIQLPDEDSVKEKGMNKVGKGKGKGKTWTRGKVPV
jgi:hypothetical protein